MENTSARNIEPIPPWHVARRYLTGREVAQYVKYFYGVTISRGRLSKWRREGILTKDGRRIYLKASKKFGNTFNYLKADVEAFLKEVNK